MSDWKRISYARDAPLLLHHRGRWIGIAPAVPL